MIKNVLKNIRPQKIELGYNPNINVEMIQEILRTHLPEYAQKAQKTWKANTSFVTLKKSFFVHALVYVTQDHMKQKTTMAVDGYMEPVALVLFGFLLHNADVKVSIVENLRVGDRVRLIRGPMKGLEGELSYIEANKPIVAIRIDGLGYAYVRTSLKMIECY